MIRTLAQVMEIARERGPKTVSVACAQDSDVLTAVTKAKAAGVADAILVGDKEQIEAIAAEHQLDLTGFEIVDIKDPAEASLKAVELVSSGKAHMVMKGMVDTSVILKAVLNKEVGLRTGNVLSHIAAFEVKGFDRLFLVTDAAMNIAPDLQTKKQIIENAVVVAKALDIEEPKVAVICAKEKANEAMPDTMDAAALTEMNVKGEITGCIVGGPFAIDNAVSVEAAKHKGINHPVAGYADVLVAPDIEGGNILYKTLGFMAFAQSAAVILGAKAPIVLTSRADSDESKLNSIALGVLCAAKLF
ncbi:MULTISPECIES: phosphate butyryltransferase [Anoxynatronum]|uniref:Phosphate butyryltransferase n=2 Tax=Anoxynatronum TaxID=210622 RepID=A0AA45WYH7_9CLOT|nr:phosphate butyryltransferase [Anoxynatronum buryatiense]SMP69185.1 phosphate butyryltransferase [Anoxynatronum buryatiense]